MARRSARAPGGSRGPAGAGAGCHCGGSAPPARRGPGARLTCTTPRLRNPLSSATKSVATAVLEHRPAAAAVGMVSTDRPLPPSVW